MSGFETEIASKMVALADKLASQVDGEFAPLLSARSNLREDLLASGDILAIDQKPAVLPRSMCAVDGARIREQMYAVDLLYAVAAARDAHFTVDQIPVPSLVWADAVRHVEGTEALTQTAMGALEVVVAARATHELVAIDGSFLTPIILLKSALGARQPTIQAAAAEILLDPELEPIKAFQTLVNKAPGTVVALVKSDSSVKFAEQYSQRFDVALDVADRVLATQILRPGEVLAPRRFTELAGMMVEEVHGSAKAQDAGRKLGAVVDSLRGLSQAGRVMVTYFKPFGAHTVIRFEFMVGAGSNVDPVAEARRLASIINADTRPPHLLEPFCQYVVDREVKKISTGARALKDRMLAHLPVERAATYRTLLAEGYRT